MDHGTFHEVAKEQIGKCLDTLIQKETEYSDGTDRLDQFKNASRIQNCHPVETLAGMMIKHTTSIYKMVREVAKGDYHSPNRWEEKIGDHINYLLLLKALLIDTTPWGQKEPSKLGQGMRQGKMYDENPG